VTDIGRFRVRAPFVRASLALHLASAATCAAWPRLWPLALGGVLLDHGLLLGGSLLPRSSLVGPNLRHLPQDEVRKRHVALTFDDGPDPEVTPRVLDCLDRSGAKATFFCVGRRAAAHAGLVAEISRRGHRVENHSYGHSNAFCLLGPWGLAKEIDRAQDLLGRLTGSSPRWFRAPAGIRNPWLDGVLCARGLELVSWTRRAFDTVCADPERVTRRLVRGLAAGDLLVLHDGGSARTSTGTPVVVEALPRLLDALGEAGLTSIPLPAPHCP